MAAMSTTFISAPYFLTPSTYVTPSNQRPGFTPIHFHGTIMKKVAM
jgi:hypothetical protein